MPTRKMMVGDKERNTVDEYRILEIFKSYNVEKACIERQWSRKGEGHMGAFTLGVGYAKLLTSLAACQIEYVDITAQQWRAVSVNPHYKELLKIEGGGLLDAGTKASSIAAVKYLYPSANIMISDRCKTPSDGLAEAILIGHYLKEPTKS